MKSNLTSPPGGGSPPRVKLKTHEMKNGLTGAMKTPDLRCNLQKTCPKPAILTLYHNSQVSQPQHEMSALPSQGHELINISATSSSSRVISFLTLSAAHQVRSFKQEQPILPLFIPPKCKFQPKNCLTRYALIF